MLIILLKKIIIICVWSKNWKENLIYFLYPRYDLYIMHWRENKHIEFLCFLVCTVERRKLWNSKPKIFFFFLIITIINSGFEKRNMYDSNSQLHNIDVNGILLGQPHLIPIIIFYLFLMYNHYQDPARIGSTSTVRNTTPTIGERIQVEYSYSHNWRGEYSQNQERATHTVLHWKESCGLVFTFRTRS